MRIAFYAPMKAPDHPVPSGDRRMAGALMAALADAGHQPELVCHFISRDGAGDAARQARLAALGSAIADRLANRLLTRHAADRPEAWFTYHLYYKAPDWLGPPIAAALDIPYVVADASFAPKQAGGPWDSGHRSVAETVAGAAAVVVLNPVDAPCLRPLLAAPDRLHQLRPFLDPAPYRAAGAARDAHRKDMIARYSLSQDKPVLLAVGMMRRGDKTASYRVLADALSSLGDAPWQLVIAGDGPARQDIAAFFDPFEEGRVHFAGRVAPDNLPGLYAAADLMVWPAINEAYGMALLEAQATGVPVVAGNAGGVASIVRDGHTGALAAEGDAAAFASALAALLLDPKLRDAYGKAASETTAREHGLAEAGAKLDRIFTGLRSGKTSKTGGKKQ